MELQQIRGHILKKKITEHEGNKPQCMNRQKMTNNKPKTTKTSDTVIF